MQVLNVARGGTLIQHLPEAVGHKGHAPETGIVGSHPVQISATSLVGKILGDAAEVPAYHHQAVGRSARACPPSRGPRTRSSRPSSCRGTGSAWPSSGIPRRATTGACSRPWSPRPPVADPGLTVRFQGKAFR